MSVNANVAMLYYGSEPHSSHRGFADSVEAELIRIDQYQSESYTREFLHGISYEYDIIISEGTRPIISAIGSNLFSNSKFIYLCSDQFFHDVLEAGYMLGSVKRYLISIMLRRFVDGIIAVSEFAESFMRPFVGTDMPLKIVHPYIDEKMFDELSNVNPTLDNKTAVTVASASEGVVGDYKGIDLLVDAWESVRKELPGAELCIYGDGHPERYNQHDGVSAEGYADSLPDVFSKASLYVQPSRADTYPVSVLEAFRAGLPVVLTSTTGNRSEVRPVDPKLIVEPTVNSIAVGIKRYFLLSHARKVAISNTLRSRSAQYNQTIWKKAFRDAVNSLI